MTIFCTVFHEEQLWPQRTLTKRHSWPPEQLPHNAETLMTNTKPPKPRGELSQLKWGGYSLQATLGWDNDYYQKIQVILTRFVTHHAAHQTQKYISAKVQRDLPKKPYTRCKKQFFYLKDCKVMQIGFLLYKASFIINYCRCYLVFLESIWSCIMI